MLLHIKLLSLDRLLRTKNIFKSNDRAVQNAGDGPDIPQRAGLTVAARTEAEVEEKRRDNEPVGRAYRAENGVFALVLARVVALLEKLIHCRVVNSCAYEA